jgi:hypothetical protein
MDTLTPRGSRPRNTQAVASRVRLWVEVDPQIRSDLIALAYERRVTYSHLVRTILAEALAAAGSDPA